MKIRKQTAIFIIVIFTILIASNTNAITTTHTVEYPTHVKLGETFTVNIEFNYALEENCLYGLYIWFHSMVNDEITTTWTSGLQKYIYTLENYPRPTNVSWTFNTLIMHSGTLETDDIIKFKISYKTGYDTGRTITFEAHVITSHYEITIGEETTIEETSIVLTAIIPIVVLFLALTVNRFTIPKREESI